MSGMLGRGAFVADRVGEIVDVEAREGKVVAWHPLMSSPSLMHEGVIALVRDNPAFAASLLRELLQVEVPPFRRGARRWPDSASETRTPGRGQSNLGAVRAH